MATQALSSSIPPLSVMTLLTSICAIVPSETVASDLAAGKGLQLTVLAEDRPASAVLSSADTVAEARWVRSQADYRLDDGGHILPHEKAPKVAAASATSSYKHDGNNNHFDIYAHAGVAECGPSLATPGEITRLVVEAAQRHNIDVAFAVAVVTAESRLDRLRNSPKGARGPMQLMPETAERFGVADICDPEDNIDGGVRYLRELTDEFRNPLLVAAAYNAGEGRVREHGGIPPFKETVGYIAEVLNIQMGLEGSGLAATELRAPAADPRRSSDASGVITSLDRRQWVGGVMHF